jgi:SAM-dependent methyltransferase
MATTADKEREFYNRVYARHLTRPDHELAINREVMLASLDDPAQTIWERRRLYLKVWTELLAEPLAGARVLDYGCGPGDWGVLLATEGARVTLLDLSEAAIELGLRRAKASGVADQVTGEARDASDLSCFADGQFDLVFGSASVHHTLKYGNAFQELVRVIRPGGRLVLAETLGNNPVLNGARRGRAWAAREPEDQGEEIIVGDREIALLRSEFAEVTVTPLNLLAMAKRLFRGRFEKRWVRQTIRVLEGSDDRLLRWFPSLGRYCGEASIVAVK